MALVRLKGSCDLVADIFRKIGLQGCYNQYIYSTWNLQQFSSHMTKPLKNPSALNKKHKSTFYLQNSQKIRRCENSIVSYLVKILNLPLDVVLCNYYKIYHKRHVKLANVKKTVNFLISYGFEKRIIRESVMICFYSSENIKRALEEIAENEDKLSMLGLSQGYAQNDKKYFTCCTKYRDKRLQLCLYYMELPYGFNGHGWLAVE